MPIMNFMKMKFNELLRYRSPSASAKSAGEQSVRSATLVGNESGALHRDRLAEGHSREPRRQECHHDPSGEHEVIPQIDPFLICGLSNISDRIA